jgi:formylglycine-generating enzyme required for sulfatase activity/tRNA A-37 threonylcarbamoyl transferase component Bud32
MLQNGDLLGGDFEIRSPLSQGGMGAVYLAHQRSTDATRVVKVMLPGLVKSPDLRERFEREARASGRIGSEHVVKMIAYGVDAARGLPWLAMEYLPGATLEERVLEGGKPSPELTFEILRQLFHGVAAAHAAGIVHRDLKPGNVYVADAQRADVPFTVKVLDFGIAKVLDPNQQGTRAMGTRAWMAPEQERVDIAISPAADVWALGLIVFWLLSGRPFWLHVGATDSLLSYEMHFAPIPPASVRSRELGMGPLHAAFDAWFEHAVTRDPGARFRDARAAWEALAPMLREVALTSPALGVPGHALAPLSAATTSAPISRGTETAAPRAQQGSRTAPLLAGLGVGGALVAAGVGLTLWLMPSEQVANGVVASPTHTAPTSAPLPAATPAPTNAASAPVPAPPQPPAGMVFVPAGTFKMGKGSAPPHGPERDVRLSRGFFIDRFETSVRQYRECVAKGACTPSGVHGPRPQPDEVEKFQHFCTGVEPGRDDYPINCIDRSQALAYCHFRHKRLPTEAEWEHAARGSDGRRFPWGDDKPSSCDRAVVSGLCPATGPRPIGQRAPSSASPFGAFDMCGNVWEWVQDTYDPQLASIAGPLDPLVGGASGRGVMRGGSWDFAVSHADAAHRLPFDPAEGHVATGVRCSADLESPTAAKTVP